MPEPEGQRKGSSTQDKNFRDSLSLLIFGDSAAAGVGVANQSEALSGQIIKQLKTQNVSWQLVAESGKNSSQALEVVKQLESKQIDYIVVSLGVNDVTSLVTSEKWLQLQVDFIQLLKDKFSSRKILLTAIPPFELFPAIPNPLRGHLASRAKRFNSSLEKICLNDGKLQFLSVELPQDTSYFAVDGFHPSAKGYALWAEKVADNLGANF
ncbi:MAG: SGNH/GDSL hydrolase family protein [Kangiellaceae bacterium]|nr:SGNH/GDSL hydrolase family protein [Kangiellaceae bacterium]MCW8999153.1 SGNH/GDSL hydrolase family protein [Kangiellaceae bacterium]MCW9015629.1 SGNH/GDSL hydrolase family protein [Kangiellaceae bacterium]